jgi:signal peptidase II
VIADQATKAWMSRALADGRVIPAFPGVAWELGYNNGAAFGTLEGANWKLAIGAIVAIALILYWARQVHSSSMAFALGLLLGGAVGNLIDRIRLGHVIDFIALQRGGQTIFPNFNVADSAITVGACLLAYSWYLSERARETASSRDSLPSDPASRAESRAES